jgi:hypothetical protein
LKEQKCNHDLNEKTQKEKKNYRGHQDTYKLLDALPTSRLTFSQEEQLLGIVI